MKFSERDELVAGLRELADFLDSPRGLELPSLAVAATAWPYDYHPRTYDRVPGGAKATMRRAARALGKADKRHEGHFFSLLRKFGPVRLELTTSREQVCEKVIIGTKEVPEVTYPARTEDVVEWVCSDSLLAS